MLVYNPFFCNTRPIYNAVSIHEEIIEFQVNIKGLIVKVRECKSCLYLGIVFVYKKIQSVRFEVVPLLEVLFGFDV